VTQEDFDRVIATFDAEVQAFGTLLGAQRRDENYISQHFHGEAIVKLGTSSDPIHGNLGRYLVL
jgi:hypothetical protein